MLYSDRTILKDNLYAYQVPERSSWENMHNRCKPNYSQAEYYFAKGISVCSRWSGRQGFLNFYADMGEKPSSEFSIERMDGDKGYEPSNCRWASPSEQSLNRKIQANNKSGYRGVSWYKPTSKWVAHIQDCKNKKLISLGYFKEKYDAALAYDCAAIQLNGSLAKLNILEVS